MGTSVTIAYLVVLGALAVLGLHRLHLVSLLIGRAEPPPPAPPERWPPVLVQLPLFNELNVAARLIDAVAQLDYPAGRLEVQVLDDSTDATRELVAERVAWHRRRGVAIEHVRRPDRSGYKAGALAFGLERSDAPLIAIFDADFVPSPGFLRATVPYLGDPTVGLVQARWEHLNRDANLLTRLQAIALDAHFRVEQRARSLTGRFFNFNGTAGVFRREAIETAGGWASDTITEDLDLSLRAQLCGWRFLYVDGVVAPAELPAGLAALRAQQRRWTRGAGQTARKLLPAIWRTPDVPARARLEATFQLLLNAAYPLLLLLALLAVPLTALGNGGGAPDRLQWLLSGLASGSVALFYVAAQSHRGARGALEAIALVPALFALGLGLSLSNGLAYLAGLGGSPTPFVRTPKSGQGVAHRYAAARARAAAWAELAIGVYVGAGVALALTLARPAAVPFLVLVATGFLAVGVASLRTRRRSDPRCPGQVPAPRGELAPLGGRKP